MRFFVGTISVESLEPFRAARLRDISSRLSLPRADVSAAIASGRDAAPLTKDAQFLASSLARGDPVR